MILDWHDCRTSRRHQLRFPASPPASTLLLICFSPPPPPPRLYSPLTTPTSIIWRPLPPPPVSALLHTPTSIILRGIFAHSVLSIATTFSCFFTSTSRTLAVLMYTRPTEMPWGGGATYREVGGGGMGRVREVLLRLNKKRMRTNGDCERHSSPPLPRPPQPNSCPHRGEQRAANPMSSALVNRTP